LLACGPPVVLVLLDLLLLPLGVACLRAAPVAW